jgi:AcrR family transcriptional regulator
MESKVNSPMAAHRIRSRKRSKPVIMPRKEPRQGRSKATCEAILQATARILSMGGLSALNTNRVAETAGVSVGSLYQYYPNKESLLTALSEEHHAQILAHLNQLLAKRAKSDPLSTTVAQVIEIALAHQFDHAALAAALEYAERDLPESKVLSVLHQGILEAIEQLLRAHARDVRGDIKTAALDIIEISSALINGAALRGEENTPSLKRRVLRAVMGYLSYAVISPRSTVSRAS